MHSNWLARLIAAGVVMAGFLLCVVLVEPPHTIPADVQFQSSFSRTEAEAYYAKARHELRQGYWASLRRDLKSLQFKCAWIDWRNGEGYVEGVVANPKNDVMAFIKFNNGKSTWITVQQARDRTLAKLTSGKLVP